MGRNIKRIISLIFAFILVFTNLGDPSVYAQALDGLNSAAADALGSLGQAVLMDDSDDALLKNEFVHLEGNWATWRVEANTDAQTLNGGSPLTLTDTFTNQSIDYSSIIVLTGSGITYDYSGSTGTFVIPDSTPVAISFRTRIAAQPGENVQFDNTAKLSGASVLKELSVSEEHVIYPSASDVASTAGEYMVKVFVYESGQMQAGVEGAQFILLDYNQRPMEYKKGANAGEPVTFVTGADGYVDVRLDEEDGDVSIQKNTAYYLEMIKAPSGFRKDNTLYSFMITDDPGYDSGSFWTYYNGDTMKIRLYPEAQALSVSLRFSGNYELPASQKNAINVVLQKKNGSNWENVESHSYTEFSYGSINFTKGSASDPLEEGATYRVIEENQSPWDLGSNVFLSTAYYLIIGSGESDQHTEPQEFTVTGENILGSFNVIINNEYITRKLSLTKMDTSSGAKLAGAEFTVKLAADDMAVTTYTTDSSGLIEISGGSTYESETLYYIVETTAPAGYLMPHAEDRIYFYFCNDPGYESTILAGLPAGETAVNLSAGYDNLTIDNQKEKVSVPVIATWQGNDWPSGVDHVVVGLYSSVDGAEPEPVLNDQSQPMTVVLSKQAPYNNNAFKDLPARDASDRDITYSIRELHIYKDGGETQDDFSRYIKEYGISDSDVYIVRNLPSASLTVSSEWYDASDNLVTDEAVISQQQSVSFDLYRSAAKIPDSVADDGITNAEMESFAAGLTKVRSGISFGLSDGWTTTVTELAEKSDLGEPYYYYVLESIPSFGEEVYIADEQAWTVLIKNRILPETADLTVEKAALVNDPRPESVNTDFSFTLVLNKGTHPIRSYKVGEGLVTDMDGEVTFTLKPETHIGLSLPLGVTATVTESYHPEYLVASESGATTSGSAFSYDVSTGTDGTVITFTNTLHVICKVVDKNGGQHPYESFRSALAYIRENPEDAIIDGAAKIQLLEDYNMPASDSFSVNAGENIILTTASADDPQFPFSTDRTDTASGTAIIRRAGVSGSIITNGGTLTLEKITLDGAGDEVTVDADGGLIYSSGTLNMTSGAALINSATTGKGSAVYIAGGTFNMPGGRIENNKAADGGAVAMYDSGSKILLYGSPIISGNENMNGEAANLFVGADSDSIVEVVAPGLSADALIGVTAMDGHMEIGEQFATAEYEMGSNLGRFVNDLYGYTGKLKDGTSTNIIWDGLVLSLNKIMASEGGNVNDKFTVTISSDLIRKSSYVINGTVDYTVTPSRNNNPGTIVLRNVSSGSSIDISPLAVGDYKITEAASDYTPAFTGTVDETHSELPITNGVFDLESSSTITLTNTRKLADLKLTKTLFDKLVGDEAVDYTFTLKLTNADGSPISGFTLAEGITPTNASGEASFTMSPSNAADFVKQFKVPVGAKARITETSDSKYKVVVSAVTMPLSGPSEVISDAETSNDNIFEFTVTGAGADITFENVRKVAVIELSESIIGKVSEGEGLNVTVKLTRNGGDPAANYVMYEDPDDPALSIAADANGQAVIPFTFGADESAKTVTLTIPEGTKLEITQEAVMKNIGGTDREIYDTAYSVNGAAASGGRSVTLNSVSESDSRIDFTNTRKTRNITVTNTVGGYSGNTVPFTFTATVTDGNTDDYDSNGFSNGELVFELATGQSRVLTVPYGATLKVEESFVVGYETLVKRGSANAVVSTGDEFTVTDNLTLAFTNNQLIKIVLVNNTSSTLTNVQIYTAYGSKMYRVNDAMTGQDPVTMTNHLATVSIDAGKTAILEVNHQNSVTYEQAYTVSGAGPASGYYYTISNEPSFHEFADPAVLRIYDTENFSVSGKLRYSVSDSTVTFSEQPLVSFDANGGSWTSDMYGYRDRDGNGKVYQLAVDPGQAAAAPSPAPVYPTDENVQFSGWTTDSEYAKGGHTMAEAQSAGKLYDFSAAVNAPLSLYAVWTKAQTGPRTVTVQNSHAETLNFTYSIDDAGSEAFSLASGATYSISVPDGAKLVVSTTADSIAVSSNFDDADSADPSFTIASTGCDGTIAFTPGICKITDAAGYVLYNASGEPAVYKTLAQAFAAYTQPLYADAAHTTAAVPAAVKMLVEEYTIQQAAALVFPGAAMTFTTASKDDADFPYTGMRSVSTIYRYAGGNSNSCFTVSLAASDITLTDITLDGGSTLGRFAEEQTNGGLINVSLGKLNIAEGSTLQNNAFRAYTNGNYGGGGAVYASGGEVNISAGTFVNLTARRGGAVSSAGGALNITGTDGGTRFERCSTMSNNANNDGANGGAVHFNADSGAISINGDSDRNNPGIIFRECVADTQWGDGGAIYVDTWYNHTVSMSGIAFSECSAKNKSGGNTDGTGGGAISAFHVKGVHVSHSTFTACDSLRGGGALIAYVKTNNNAGNSAVSVTDCSFADCNCMGQGGAISCYQDNNGATASRTEFYVADSTFTNCSSGTNNGSGGCVQCYLPCVEFNGCTFSDCWAGKEGGAVNNWYGANRAEMWTYAYMNVIDCSFIRCRAEDRYDLTGIVHYGGGISTKAKTLLVQGSYFEDCVSTLKQGGAVHCSGIGAGSSVTIESSTFVNCSAKDNGGAFMASSETMTVSGSNFYGCSSFAANGGAVYHGESVNKGTQAVTNIENCVFSADPAGGSSALSCSSALNGGAVWTRAMTVSISNTTAAACSANGDGGAVYLRINGSQSALLSGCSITDCSAVRGSAVYAENNVALTLSASTVSGNTVSDIGSAAVHGAGNGNRLYFEGSVKVENNPCSSDTAFMHDVLMQRNSNKDADMTVIQTTANGLEFDAHIGIYIPDSVFGRRGTEGRVFGIHAASGSGSAYLENFFNDRDDTLFGYKQSSSDSYIYWGRYLCKITDAEGNTLTRSNGRDAVYQRLTMALYDFTSVTGGTPVYIKILIENYELQQTAQITNFPAADVTITTAGSDDAKYPYRGTAGTVCTLSRTNSNNQLFKLDTAGAVLRFENITLDGRKDKSASQGDYRLIEAANGRLVIGGGTSFLYGYTGGNGGAILISNANASLEIHSAEGKNVVFDHCVQNNANDKGGGAIYSVSGLTIDGTGSGKTSFINCTARRGGAVMLDSATATSAVIDRAEFINCSAPNEGGAFYHNNNSGSAETVLSNCVFENCRTHADARWSYGGAVNSKAGTLRIDSCSFTDCYAVSNGGAVNHGSEQNNRVKTEITDSDFTNCRTTGSNNSYGYGGSVFTQAKLVELTGCSFTDSSSYNDGGAINCQNNTNEFTARISGTSFDNCKVTRSNGDGGAVYINGRVLLIQDTEDGASSSFTACSAPGRGGAVYVNANNSTITVTGGTQITNCTADRGGAFCLVNGGTNLNIDGDSVISGCYAKQGGAVFVENGTVMSISGSPEFARNGYTTQGSSVVEAEKGACIYLAQGGRLNLSGSPKFSRNILPKQERVVNGGILDNVRQDVYLAGYSGQQASSVNIT